jgi:hypothetical protein
MNWALPDMCAILRLMIRFMNHAFGKVEIMSRTLILPTAKAKSCFVSLCPAHGLGFDFAEGKSLPDASLWGSLCSRRDYEIRFA